MNVMPKSDTLYWVTKMTLENWTSGKIQKIIKMSQKHTLLIYTKNKEIDYIIRQKSDDNIKVSYTSYATSGPRPMHILIDPDWYNETENENFEAAIAATTGLIDINFLYDIKNIEKIYITETGTLKIKYTKEYKNESSK